MRRRLTLVSAAIAAATLLSVSVATYVAVRHELRARVDEALDREAQRGTEVSRADETFAGRHVRVLTVRERNATVRVVRSLEATDRTLSRLRIILAALCAAGIALAALLGRLTARRVLRPLTELAAVAAHIRRTGSITRRIHPEGDDEVARLGRELDALLDALEHARETERRLVADASHELRTPVSALRARVERLERAPAEERPGLVRDV